MENKFKPARVRYEDVMELAAHILNLEEPEDGFDIDTIDEAVYEKFDCSFDTFESIVRHLLPLANSNKSPLTDEVYRGFSTETEEGMGIWIIKEKA